MVSRTSIANVNRIAILDAAIGYLAFFSLASSVNTFLI